MSQWRLRVIDWQWKPSGMIGHEPDNKRTIYMQKLNHKLPNLRQEWHDKFCLSEWKRPIWERASTPNLTAAKSGQKLVFGIAGALVVIQSFKGKHIKNGIFQEYFLNKGKGGFGIPKLYVKFWSPIYKTKPLPNMAKYAKYGQYGVSLERSCKMQFRRVDLASIGPPVKSYDQIKFLADFPIVITM